MSKPCRRPNREEIKQQRREKKSNKKTFETLK
jgi:hypothetical protein